MAYELKENWAATGVNIKGFLKAIDGINKITHTLSVQLNTVNLAWYNAKGKSYVFVGDERYPFNIHNNPVLDEVKNEVTDVLMYNEVPYLCTPNAVSDLARQAGIGGPRFGVPSMGRTHHLADRLSDMKDSNATLVYRIKGPIRRLIGVRGNSYQEHQMSLLKQSTQILGERGYEVMGWKMTNHISSICFKLPYNIGDKVQAYVKLSDSVAGESSFLIVGGIKFDSVEAPVITETIEHDGELPDREVLEEKLNTVLNEVARYASISQNAGLCPVKNPDAVLDRMWELEGGSTEGKTVGVAGFFKKGARQRVKEEIRSHIGENANYIDILTALYTSVLDCPEEIKNKKYEGKVNFAQTFTCINSLSNIN